MSSFPRAAYAVLERAPRSPPRCRECRRDRFDRASEPAHHHGRRRRRRDAPRAHRDDVAPASRAGSTVIRAPPLRAARNMGVVNSEMQY